MQVIGDCKDKWNLMLLFLKQLAISFLCYMLASFQYGLVHNKLIFSPNSKRWNTSVSAQNIHNNGYANQVYAQFKKVLRWRTTVSYNLCSQWFLAWQMFYLIFWKLPWPLFKFYLPVASLSWCFMIINQLISVERYMLSAAL